MTHSGNSVCGYYGSTPFDNEKELTKEEQYLYDLMHLVIKAKDRYKKYYNELRKPSENRFLYQTKAEAFEVAEFKEEVYLRLEECFENKMFDAYGKDWKFNSPFLIEI